MNPSQVEAAFLRNFAHYVTWPPQAFSSEQSPWRVCVLGPDPFGGALERTFSGRTELGRTFEIHRAGTLPSLPPCHIVFVAYPEPASRRAALDELKKRSVLTVGDAPDFLDEGGVIRFRVTDFVEMSINLDQARRASLTIPTRMLEVSHEILEHGVLRRAR